MRLEFTVQENAMPNNTESTGKCSSIFIFQMIERIEVVVTGWSIEINSVVI
jgi:hypothetical protein